jgi:hypothetical protein
MRTFDTLALDLGTVTGWAISTDGRAISGSESFKVGDRDVTVSISALRTSAGGLAFSVLWRPSRPARLTAEDIEIFDRGRRKAIAELRARLLGVVMGLTSRHAQVAHPWLVHPRMHVGPVHLRVGQYDSLSTGVQGVVAVRGAHAHRPGRLAGEHGHGLEPSACDGRLARAVSARWRQPSVGFSAGRSRRPLAIASHIAPSASARYQSSKASRCSGESFKACSRIALFGCVGCCMIKSTAGASGAELQKALGDRG